MHICVCVLAHLYIYCMFIDWLWTGIAKNDRINQPREARMRNMVTSDVQKNGRPC